MAVQGLGTDVALLSDLGLSFGLVSGQKNVAYALARRFDTPRGGLVYDPEYGTDIKSYLNASMTPVQLANLQADMVSEALKDQRVRSFDVASIVLINGRHIATCPTDTEFGPFDLILAISDTTIDVLDAAAPAPATPADVLGGIFVGPVGATGATGATGSAGGGGSGITLSQAIQMSVSSGGEETIYGAGIVDFGTLPGSITIEITAQALAAAGTGTYRLRIGGTSADPTSGTVVASFTATTPAFVDKLASVTIVNPTGQLFVKVTGQNSIPGQSTNIRTVIVTIR